MGRRGRGQRREVDHPVRRALLPDPGVDGLSCGLATWTRGATAGRGERGLQYPKTLRVQAVDHVSVPAGQLLDGALGDISRSLMPSSQITVVTPDWVSTSASSRRITAAP